MIASKQRRGREGRIDAISDSIKKTLHEHDAINIEALEALCAVAVGITTAGCDSDNPSVAEMAGVLSELLMPFASAVVGLADGVEAREG